METAGPVAGPWEIGSEPVVGEVVAVVYKALVLLEQQNIPLFERKNWSIVHRADIDSQEMRFGSIFIVLALLATVIYKIDLD